MHREIEPIMFTVHLEKSNIYQVFLLNKFEQLAFYGELNLLVWSFNDIVCSDSRNTEQLLILLDKSEQSRFTFVEKKIFSRLNTTIEENRASVKLSIQLKERAILELVFESKKLDINKEPA